MRNTEYLSYNSPEAVSYYARVYTGFWDEFPDLLAEDYIQAVKQVPQSQSLVLCIGSGLGNEAEMLKSYGLTPVCLDGAREMVCASAAKGLTSVQGNFLKLPFGKAKFDGVFTYKTLNHTLNLEQLQACLLEISRVLKNRGALSICMLRAKQDGRKSSFFDGISTRENLFLTEETFSLFLENNNFLIETFSNIRRGHTDYLVANAVKYRNKH